MQCVCQVFYLKDTTKWWKVKFAFCSRPYLDVSYFNENDFSLIIINFIQDMKAFYHDAIIGECIDVEFTNTSVPIYTLSNDTTKNGWNMTSYFQLKVEGFITLYNNHNFFISAEIIILKLS